jgi:hypothetical protein
MPDLPGALSDRFVCCEGRKDVNLPLDDRSKLIRVEEVVEVTHFGGGSVRGKEKVEVEAKRARA